MSVGTDSLVDLDKHCQVLEENVKQLQAALQHWRTWDADYEVLKEEVQGLPSSADASQILQVRDTFEGELLVGKELDEIFGPQQTRGRDQIVNLLGRRVDYVTVNIKSLSQQLETAEARYTAASIVSAHAAVDDDGQPITEIVEQLDDDDNVISYKLNQPGESLPQMQEALENAGVGNLSELQEALESESKAKSTSTVTSNVAAPAKKSVAFAEDTKPAEEPKADMAHRARRVEQIMQTAKDQEQHGIVDPVHPVDEDPEDALLRREMLKYGVDEVGAVVAELQLDEGDDDEEEDEDWMEEDEDEDDGEYDGFGRYKGSIITDEYRQRMLELEQKLGIKSRFTAAAEAKASNDGDDDGEGFDERVGRITIKQGETGLPTSKTTLVPSKSNLKQDNTSEGSGKKGVKFAPSLDISDVPQAAASNNKDVIEPLSDIVERPARASITATAPTTQKPSRFRQENVASGNSEPLASFLPQKASRPPPSGPAGMTIADKLVEKETTSNPTEPDDMDDTNIHFEVADEHHRLRKKFIQREGGFLQENQSATQSLEEEDGGMEPMSRFKAARLSRQ